MTTSNIMRGLLSSLTCIAFITGCGGGGNGDRDSLSNELGPSLQVEPTAVLSPDQETADNLVREVLEGADDLAEAQKTVLYPVAFVFSRSYAPGPVNLSCPDESPIYSSGSIHFTQPQQIFPGTRLSVRLDRCTARAGASSGFEMNGRLLVEYLNYTDSSTFEVAFSPEGLITEPVAPAYSWKGLWVCDRRYGSTAICHYHLNGRSWENSFGNASGEREYAVRFVGKVARVKFSSFDRQERQGSATVRGTSGTEAQIAPLSDPRAYAVTFAGQQQPFVVMQP